jgi:hypothetical protein
MSKFHNIKLIISIALAIFFIPAIALANMIKMHEQPTDTSRIAGTIDLSAGVIPIFTPKNSQWIKVADPVNGNTGWIKNSDLKDSQGNIITFSQQVTNSGSGQTVQMMQSSGNTLTPEQKKKLETQVQEQEQFAKETVLKAQKNMSEIMENLKKLYQQQLDIMQQTGSPVLLPNGQPTQQANPNMPQHPTDQLPGQMPGNQMQQPNPQMQPPGNSNPGY